ncbi:3-oxoacyl-ACP synthase II chloroplastic-like, partial [Trifolium medium]|nr:3-oxoacyl-ACP synthase II chloroplastic-like [Trifolium medium]
KRGATIYAEFLGGSFTCDAYHVTEPRPDGLRIYEALTHMNTGCDTDMLTPVLI